MKRIATTALIFCMSVMTSSASIAQNMSEADMQGMMEKVQEAQACFANIDPNVFKEIETKGRKMEAELKGLCAEGKRNEAMTKAMKYAKEFKDSEEMKEIEKCSKIMENMDSAFPIPDFSDRFEHETEEFKDGHVCEGI